MDYEQRYKDALRRAKKLYGEGTITECLGWVFPELKESEDEEIRKWLINEIKIKHHNLDEENIEFVDKAIAWLEKQRHMLDPDKVIEWLENKQPSVGVYDKFKKDFGL